MDNCGQNFPTKASLRYHMLKHEGQREYQCSFPGCEKKFLTLSQLKQHENSSSVHKNIRVSALQDEEESYFYMEEPPISKRREFEDSVVPNLGDEMKNFEGESNLVLENQDPGQMLNKMFKENELLKKKLEESQKLITILQQRVQLDPFAYMDHFSTNDLFADRGSQMLSTDMFFTLEE